MARRGQPEKAIESLHAILVDDAFQSTARRSLVDIYRTVGRDEEAVELLRASVLYMCGPLLSRNLN